jgi:hypothetical protein
MRFSRWLQRGALLVAVGACGGGKAAPKDGGAGIGGGIGGSGVGGSAGGAGGTDGGLVGCLETPGALDRPPAGRLPCELVPPGVRL